MDGGAATHQALFTGPWGPGVVSALACTSPGTNPQRIVATMLAGVSRETGASTELTG